MTLDDRVAALDFLGLTPRQTHFVATVALHGGYCLRRQYATSAGLAYGATVRDFLDHLVHRRLMTRVEYRHDRGFVYHLRAKRIYRAIEQNDNRNRRHVSPALIARKLMLLDVVLAHRDATWFATEQDKVALFTTRFGVPLAALPQRIYVAGSRPPSSSASPAVAPSTTRYFVNKWPIFLSAEGDAARVNFVALIVESTGQAFRHFLTDHLRLFRHLPAWTVVAACPTGHAGLAACRVAFERTFSPRPVASGSSYPQCFSQLDPDLLRDLRVRRGESPSSPSQSPLPESDPLHDLRALRGESSSDLARYFETRRSLETGALASVSIADVDHYREARTHFIGPAVEQSYARWRVLARVAPEPVSGLPPGPANGGTGAQSINGGAGEFRPYPLPFTYQQFGDFAGEC
jgi:hypothetical protein